MTKVELQLHQEVWFPTTYVDVNSGIVEGFISVRSEQRVKVEGTRDTFGTFCPKLSECFTSEKELLEYLQHKSNSKVKEYCSQLTDLESVLRFMYSKHVACAEEYTDWEARRAVRQRVKELFGIDLESR